MKKSEIVNLLLTEINYRQYQDYQFDYSDAEKILDVLLEAGMLPPPNGTDAVSSSIIYAYYDDRVSGDDDGRPIVEKLWEQE
jgi:hypothetical protein